MNIKTALIAFIIVSVLGGEPTAALLIGVIAGFLSSEEKKK